MKTKKQNNMEKYDLLNDEILQSVKLSIKQKGIEKTLDRVYEMLEESKALKERLLLRKTSLGNVESHIKCELQLIDYLTEMLIKKNIKIILAK